MNYLHTMIRVHDLDRALDFFVNKMGMKEVRRTESEKGQYTNVFLAASDGDLPLELTYNWHEPEPYATGRFFGHLAYAVDNIYEYCADLQSKGVDILRPPRDGKMAFIKAPDGQSIELLQAGDALPAEEPWASMQNQGSW
ncbi:MAG: VOC family protein [Chloroflexota bacterium]